MVIRIIYFILKCLIDFFLIKQFHFSCLLYFRVLINKNKLLKVQKYKYENIYKRKIKDYKVQKLYDLSKIRNKI